MEGKTLEQVREVLLERWRMLGKSASDREKQRNHESETAEGAAGQAEIIDIAQSLEQMGRDSSLAEQERREFLAIERALAKMETGSFGYCEDCGDEIPPKRLMVLPEARLCANCQAFEERQNARVRPVRAAAR